MRDFSADHRWLSINTATVRRQRGQDWPLLEIIDACAQRGIGAISEAPPDATVPPGSLKMIFQVLELEESRDPAFRFWKVELENP